MLAVLLGKLSRLLLSQLFCIREKLEASWIGFDGKYMRSAFRYAAGAAKLATPASLDLGQLCPLAEA
jgi:hypothetical protein